jgi:hypothetical protein
VTIVSFLSYYFPPYGSGQRGSYKPFTHNLYKKPDDLKFRPILGS